MKKQVEILKRKLKLYDSREEFKQKSDRLIKEQPNNEYLEAALKLAYATYSAKIAELNWVLGIGDRE